MFSNNNETSCLKSAYYFIQGKECPTEIECPVKGSIPNWVNGRLLRNGPGEHSVGKETYKHWFDGHALLHSFELREGRVFYKSKFIRSDVYNCHKKHERIIFGGIGNVSYPDPCKTIFQKFFSYFIPTEPQDNCCVNVCAIGDSYYAITDHTIMRKFDPDNLDTTGKVDLTKVLSVHTATAHPHTDTDGTVYNLGIQFGRATSICIVKMPKDETFAANSLPSSSIIAKIPVSNPMRPSYLHSFGMTENYIIVAENSLQMHVSEMFAATLRKKTLMDALKFDNDEPVKFSVVSKTSGKMMNVNFTADPFFAFHHINAYEEDDQIVLDLVRNERENRVLEIFLFKTLKNEDNALEKIVKEKSERPSVPCRYVIPLNTENAEKGENLVTLKNCQSTAVKQENGSVHLTPEVLIEQRALCDLPGGIEMPAINHDYNAKKYRYSYYITQDTDEIYLAKLDVETKEVKIRYQEGEFASEPVFIPSLAMKSEDDGIVLSVILTRNIEIPTYLLVLDAKTFTEIARAEMNIEIPPGLHHRYAPSRS